MKNQKLAILAVFLSGVSATSAPTFAQTDDDGGFVLEEIIVTAQKFEQDLQEVPLAITALSGASLAQQGIINIQDIENQVPNVEMSYGQGDTSVTIRGITTSQQANASLDDNTAIHVDGFYVTDTAIAGLDFIDIERIEIARGPQGTIYGRNAVAGAVNIISRKPDPENFDAWVELEAGNFSTFAVRAGLNIPVGEKSAFRFAGLNRQTDGYMHHGILQRDYLENDVSGFRAAFRYAGDRVTIDLKGEYHEEDGDGTPLVVPLENAAAIAETVCNTPGMNCLDPSQFTLPTTRYDTTSLNDGRAEFREEEFTSVGLTIEFELTDNLSLRSLTGFRDFESTFLSDLDSFDWNQAWDLFLQTGEQTSQELVLYSTNDESRLRWLLGAFYMDFEKGWDIDVFQGFDERYPSFTSQQAILPNQQIDATASAIFGNIAFAFNDKFDVQLGLRYNKEEKDNSENDVFQLDLKDCELEIAPGLTLCEFVFGVPITNPFLFFDETNTASGEWTDTSGDLTLRYFPADDKMAYFRYARGFKSGGFNFLLTPPGLTGGELSQFEPEIVDNYEAGVKADWNEGRLRTNLTVFVMDFKDQQINRLFTDPVTGLPIFTTENAGSSEITGVELEIDAILNDNWRLEFTGALLDAKYDEYFTVAGDNMTEVDLSGVRMGSAPRYSLQAALNYATTLGSGARLDLRGEIQHRDKVDSISPNTDGSEFINIPRPEYTLLNAHITYTSRSGRWGVTLFGRNLTDEWYLLSQPSRTTLSNGDVVARFQAPAAPRNYGVRFNYNY